MVTERRDRGAQRGRAYRGDCGAVVLVVQR